MSTASRSAACHATSSRSALTQNKGTLRWAIWNLKIYQVHTCHGHASKIALDARAFIKFEFCSQQNKLKLVTCCCLSVQPLPKLSTDECAVKTVSRTTCKCEWSTCCLSHNYNMYYPAYTVVHHHCKCRTQASLLGATTSTTCQCQAFTEMQQIAAATSFQ